MRLCCIVLLLAASIELASAQVGEVSLSLGESRFTNNSLGSDPSVGEFKITNGFRLAFRLTLNTYRFFGHEIGYAYSRSHLAVPGQEVGMPVHQAFYNFLVYATPEGSRIRPFG